MMEHLLSVMDGRNAGTIVKVVDTVSWVKNSWISKVKNQRFRIVSIVSALTLQRQMIYKDTSRMVFLVESESKSGY